MNKTSIIISAQPEQLEYLQDCLQSIRRFTDRGTYELIVVENGGEEELRFWLADQTDVLSMFHEQKLSQAQAWNKGLELASGDSIAFLHNDTLVNESWLLYMLQTLYQSENIAVVGPISNHADADQQVDVSFESMEQMLQYARTCQRNFEQQESLVLSSFCLLFKREALDKVGLFDEQLPDNDVSADYGLRLQELQYKLLITRNVYIHHYGDEEQELQHSVLHTQAFARKWGWSSNRLQSNPVLLQQASSWNNEDESIAFLQIGSGTGAELLKIQQSYPELKGYGLETKVKEDHWAAAIRHQIRNNLEYFSSNEYRFRYIYVQDTDHLVERLPHYMQLLEPKGKLIASFTNFNSYTSWKRLFNNEAPTATEDVSWNLGQIRQLFENQNLHIAQIDSVKQALTKEDQEQVNQWRTVSGRPLPPHFEVEQFIVTAILPIEVSGLQDRFNALFQNPTEAEALTNELLTYAPAQILAAVQDYSGPVIPLLNYLALSHHENRNLDQIFPLLDQAYELNPQDVTTLMNLGTIHYGLGHEQQALDWFKKLPTGDPQIEQWIYELEETLSLKNDHYKWLQFLLLRIEHNVERNDSLNELLRLIERGEVYADELESVIQNDIIEQLHTCNILVNYFYEKEEYELVIAVLELVLKYSPERDNTLFLIANMQYKLSQYNQALNTMNMITLKETKVVQLKQLIDQQMSSSVLKN